MKCPFCSQSGTRVLETKESGASTRRLRRCQHCGQEYRTRELPDMAAHEVLKKDGSREQWNKEKYLASVRKAFSAKDAELYRVRINKLGEIMEQYVRADKARQRPTSAIAEATIRRLRLIDTAAAFRYTSVYYGYSGSEFIAMIQGDHAANNLRQVEVADAA